MSRISLMNVISQEDTFYGMCPTTVLSIDFDGNVRLSPISIVQDQQGPNVHFLDNMQIMQLSPGICNVKMYDNRDSTEFRKPFPELIFPSYLLKCGGNKKMRRDQQMSSNVHPNFQDKK